MSRKLDIRTLIIMLAATLVGAAWAYYNYTSTGGERGEDQLQRLVWTIFSTPFVLFIGWLLARRAELWLAAFVCFCLYFFTPFVGARIESLMMSAEEARHSGHHAYFVAVMVIHLVAGGGISVWRATRSAPASDKNKLHPPADRESVAQASSDEATGHRSA